MSAPFERRPIVEQAYDLDAVERTHGLDAWLQAATARALANLEQQVAEALQEAPPGARICVHGPEATITDGPGLMVDDYVIRWRQQLHELADGEQCLKGTGGRIEYRVSGPITYEVTE